MTVHADIFGSAAGQQGVPTRVIEGEPLFGQDRTDLAMWRMEQKEATGQ